MFAFLGDDGDDGLDGVDGDQATPTVAPGDGTAGEAGEDGEGLIGHLLDQSDVVSGDLEVQAGGGFGGDGGGGGIGGSSGAGEPFSAGNGGNGGAGGIGGDVNIGISAVLADNVEILVAAGYGGDGGGWNSGTFSGNGGKAGEDGNNGGHGGHGGVGGAGGGTSLTLADSEVGFTFIQIAAGNGGMGGDGSDGGEGATGGTAGAGGNAGLGGDGGAAALYFFDNHFVTSDGRGFAASGGDGGDGGYQGYGADAGAGDDGYNGDGGQGGDGAVSVSGNTFDFTSDCGCEDGIVIYAIGGQGGFGYAGSDSSLDGVSGAGGDAYINFSGNLLTATATDVVISLAFTLNAGQGGVYFVDPTDTTAGTKGADGTTDLVFGNNTIQGSAGDYDTFRLDVENFVFDDALTGVGIAPIGTVIIDLTAGYIDLGSGALSVIDDIEHVDVIIRDGYYDDALDFYDSYTAVYLNGNGADNDLGSSTGDDDLNGQAGNDTLNGYAGADTVTGGLGNDFLYVDDVNDVVVELVGEGTDAVVSEISYSLVGTNIENLYLDKWYDTDGTGNDGNNLIVGSAGNNIIDGGLGADSMYGGDSDDTFYVDNVGDKVYEDAGMGKDTVVSTVSFSLVGRVVENLTLTGIAHINATGNTLANTLTGNDGNNLINGGENYDKMYGGLGDDTYFVDNLDDKVFEYAGQGTDVLYTSVEYDLTGRHIEVVYQTGSDNIALYGNTLANELHGNSGNNLLDGRAGNDSLSGGAGDDTYVVNTSGDVVTELDGEGTDTVETTRSYTLGDFVENLFLTGASDINGTGNGLNNALVGNDGHNVLAGGLGDDSYYVQAGNDVVIEAAGQGNDMVYSTVSFSLWGTHVEGLQLTGTGNVDATGNNQVNSLFGNDGDNVINGGGAGDLLWGGIGADTFDFDAGCRSDNIYDFDASEGDKIDISAFTGGVAYSNGVTISDFGGTAQIRLGSGNYVWVHNTNAADTDFLNAIIW